MTTRAHIKEVSSKHYWEITGIGQTNNFCFKAKHISWLLPNCSRQTTQGGQLTASISAPPHPTSTHTPNTYIHPPTCVYPLHLHLAEHPQHTHSHTHSHNHNPPYMHPPCLCTGVCGPKMHRRWTCAGAPPLADSWCPPNNHPRS